MHHQSISLAIWSISTRHVFSNEKLPINLVCYLYRLKQNQSKSSPTHTSICHTCKGNYKDLYKRWKLCAPVVINQAISQPALLYQHYLSSCAQSLLDTSHVCPRNVIRDTMGTTKWFGRICLLDSALNFYSLVFNHLTIPAQQKLHKPTPQ